MDAAEATKDTEKSTFDALIPEYVKEIYSALSSSQSEVKEAESEGLVTLTEEANKQRIVMEFQEHQARVAQELAIAERIASSHEVEIEEFYEGSGKGNLGLSSEGSSLSFGASGEGRRVTKRIIRFSGWSTIDKSKGEV